MPVKAEHVILPLALDRSQLLGINIHSHTHSFKLSLRVFCLRICKTTMVLSVRACVFRSDLPLPSSVSSGETGCFRQFEKRDGYVSLSYWTNSFSGSSASPYGLSCKRFMGRIICVTDSKPKMSINLQFQFSFSDV